MKIVIDIPEEIYNHTQEYEVGGFNQENDTKLFIAIKNGTPLPKGHGDLKDYDAIKSEYIRKMSVFMSEGERMDLLCGIIDDAPTVIEADKEVEECENVTD